MRGINLSALTARGRAAEAMHSAREQAAQAAKLRKRISEIELKSLQSKKGSKEPQTVDVLGSISGQSALARLAVMRASEPSIPVVSESRFPQTLERLAQSSTGNARPVEVEMNRALGANKFGLYQKVASSTPKVRALPGTERYADGAAVGVASLSVATSIVASVGLAIGAAFYFNPELIHRLRGSTIRVRERLETGVGERMRIFSEDMRRDDGFMSEETKKRANEFAGSVAKSFKSKINSVV